MASYTLTHGDRHSWSADHDAGTSSIHWLRERRRLLRNWMERRRLYNETVRELEGLSNRELDDIGIARFDIPAIARASVAANRKLG